jgi:hypothetical protein
MKRAAERSETRSKWSRLMRYAVAYKPNSQPLEQFVRRKGGINACAARFTRWLERSATRLLTHRAGQSPRFVLMTHDSDRTARAIAPQQAISDGFADIDA